MNLNHDTAVLDRYSQGAKASQAELCCPVDYDTGLLKALPPEIIERDYGCGDPSRYVRAGDTVLDLGSGGGKICFMAAQIVGDGGRVIGVDMNDDMLALARSYQQEMQDKFGARIDFNKGHIQDLALDVAAMEAWLRQNPVASAEQLRAFEDWKAKQRRQQPLIADNSVSLVLSNCVLNLVSDSQKQQLAGEIWRVVRPGGRIAISDIVADKPIPQAMKDDAELWSGCISGAFGEREFLNAFAAAGFADVRYDKWEARPWKVINEVTFRSVTLVGVKPQSVGAGAVMYRGPHAAVADRDGEVFMRGERRKVSAAARGRLLAGGDFIDVDAEGDSAAGSSSCCGGDSADSAGSGCC